MLLRGMTLIEMLIALALLAAILALVAPPLAQRFADRSFEAVQAEVQAHLALARAEAMAAGSPREVRFLPNPSRLVIVPFEPRTASVVDGGVDDPEAGNDPASPRGGPGASRRETHDEFAFDFSAASAEATVWTRLDLPPGIHVRVDSPGQAIAGEVDDEERDIAFGIDPSVNRPLRVAVFLSDGSVLATRDVWLVDEDHRAGRLVVNPWTGLAQFERSVPPRDDGDGFLLADTTEPPTESSPGSSGRFTP